LRSKKNNEDDRWSEHGLGHLLNPMDIKTKNGIEVENQYREWIAEISLNIIVKPWETPHTDFILKSIPQSEKLQFRARRS